MPQPIIPPGPRSVAALAAFVLILFYTFGLLLSLIRLVADSIATAVFGGILLFGGVYYTVQWIRAKRRDSN